MSTDTPRYSTPRLRAFALWAQALSAEGNSLGDVLQTYVDNWADDIAALAQQPTVPLDMILHCPACHEQHVDKPEGTFIPGFTGEESAAWNKERGMWDNPPHRSHLCHGCGHIWRPADVPTNGVAAIKTKGKADSPALGKP